MKRLLLAAALGAAGLLATPAAQAQTTDTTYVKPNLNTAPPGSPVRRRTTPVPQPQPQQPAQPVAPAPQPTTPAAPRSSGGIDDDGRVAQPLPGSRPQQVPQPTQPSRPTIDDDGRAAKQLPASGTVPGASVQQSREPSKYFLYTNFNLGLSGNEFNGTEFSVGASPAIGYRVTDKFAIGPGIAYTFNNSTFSPDLQPLGFPRSFQSHNIGLKAFAQYIVFQNFFVHAEYEVTRAQYYDVYRIGQQQYEVRRAQATIRTPLAGVGYRQKFGERVAGDIALLYNFNTGLRDIYGQPVLRFSFLFDLGK